MATPADPTARIPPSELGYQIFAPYSSDGCRIDWDDGSSWFLSRMDCGGIAAERWYEPDELEDEEFGPWRDCPGPDFGVFATVDGIEVAMGTPLPDDVYNAFHVADVDRIVTEDEKASWGRIYAFEIVHLLDDGTLIETWAPPWADDPLDPAWDIDCR